MIDQVLALHKESKWLHIGCDEVFQIGLCNLCQNQDINQLFLNHGKFFFHKQISGFNPNRFFLR